MVGLGCSAPQFEPLGILDFRLDFVDVVDQLGHVDLGHASVL